MLLIGPSRVSGLNVGMVGSMVVPRWPVLLSIVGTSVLVIMPYVNLRMFPLAPGLGHSGDDSNES